MTPQLVDHAHTDSCAAIGCNLVQPRRKMNMFVSGCSHSCVTVAVTAARCKVVARSLQLRRSHSVVADAVIAYRRHITVIIVNNALKAPLDDWWEGFECVKKKRRVNLERYTSPCVCVSARWVVRGRTWLESRSDATARIAGLSRSWSLGVLWPRHLAAVACTMIYLSYILQDSGHL